MIWKRILCFVLLMMLLVPWAGAIEVSAKSAALYDPELQRFLFEKESDLQLPMASTTKLMTALLALERLPMEQEVLVAPECLRTEGSSMYLVPGERVTVKELLYGLLLLSGNDAAKVLAKAAWGSEDAFVEQMNLRAKALGMTQTHFENPHGLPEEGHVSTARDMALLMAECLKNEMFRTVSGTKLYNGDRVMQNHNKLLSLYPETIGGKTGFTKEAGRCLVTAAERQGSSLIAVTLSAPDDWNDHIALFEYGFAQYPLREVFPADENRLTLPVQSGMAPVCTLCSERSLALRLTEEEASRISIRLFAPAFLYAPLTKGEQMGEAVIFLGGEELTRIPLCCETEIPLLPQEKTFWEKCNLSFKKIANRLSLW